MSDGKGLDKETAQLMIDSILGQLMALKDVVDGTYDGEEIEAACEHDILWNGDGSGMCRKAECAQDFPAGTLE
jgi:hypothetical protein